MRKLIKKIRMAVFMLFAFHIPSAFANAQGGNGGNATGRGLLEGVKDARELTQESGGLMYDVAITTGIGLMFMGLVVFALSSRANGDQSKSKAAAAIMLIGGIALTSITAFTNMGAITVTGQESEMTAFLGE